MSRLTAVSHTLKRAADSAGPERTLLAAYSSGHGNDIYRRMIEDTAIEMGKKEKT